MRRTLRYISYTLMYLIISIASAYGVILISTSSPNEGTEASVPQQITNIVERISNSPTIEADISFALQSEGMNASADISLSVLNSQSVSANADIDLTVNDQTTSVTIAYQNSTIYASAFNNKFQISSNNLISSIGQILSLLNFDLSSMGIDISSLDLNMILSLFSNLEETKLERQNILDITLPVVGSMQIITDKAYRPLSVSLPSASLGKTSFAVNATLNYPESVEIPTILPEEYINLDYIFEIIDAGENLLSQSALGLSGQISVSGKTYPALISSNKDDGSFIINVDIDGNDARLILQEGKIYFDFQNIYLKFDLSQTDELVSVIEKLLNVSLSNGLIDIILNLFANNIISLPGDINLGNFDLSVIEKFEKIDNNYLLVIRDFGQITLETEDQVLSYLSISGQDFSLSLEPKEFVETIEIEEDKYAELSTLLPVLNNALEIMNSPSSYGTFGLNLNDIAISGSYKLALQNNGLVLMAEIELLGETFNLTIKNNNIYLYNNAINLLLPLEDVSELFDFMQNYFGIDLSSNSLIEMIEDLLSPDPNANPLLSLTQSGDRIVATFSSGLKFEAITSNDGLLINAYSQDFVLDFSLSGSEEVLTPPSFIISNFVQVTDLLKTAGNMIDYFSSGNFSINVTATYDNLLVYGYVKYKDGMISAKLNLDYASQSFNIIFMPNSQGEYNLYIKTGSLGLKLDAASLDELFSIIDTFFGFDIKGLLENLQNDFSSQIKDFDLSSLDLSMISSITKNAGVLDYKGYNATLSIKNNFVPRATITSDKLKLILIPLESEEYINVYESEYTTVSNLPQNLSAILNSMQNSNGNMSFNLKFDNGSATSLNGSLQFALGQNPTFNASLSVADLAIGAGLFDQVFYVNFDGLKAKLDFDSMTEVADILLPLLGVNASLKDMFDSVDFSSLFTIMMTALENTSSLGADEMLSLISYLKSITSTENSLTLTFDSSIMGVSGKEMSVVLNFANNKISKINLKNFYLSSTSKIDLDLTFNTFTGVNRFSDLNQYMDLSSLKNVLKAGANMADQKKFKVEGQADLSIIGINKSMPFSAMLSLENPLDPMVIVELDIPTMTAINNDDSEKYEFGDVNGGENRKLKIYYKGGYIYMHRTETIGKAFGSRNYERKVKLGINEFVENIVYYLADWGFGLNSYIMDAINEAVERSRNRPTPIDYSKVLLGVNNSGKNYGITLNLAEIAYSELLDKANINVSVATKSGKEVIDTISVDMNLPFTSAIEMSIKIDNAKITTGTTFNKSEITSFIKSYKFATSFSYHLTSDGWELM